MIINPRNISWRKILEDLIVYIKGKPNNESWKDFYDGSLGLTFLELLAGFGTNIAYQTITGRREVLLQYAENISSLRAISEMLGYSTWRGRNTILNINFTPNVTTTIAEWDIVGFIKDAAVVSLESKAINNGTPVDLKTQLTVLSSEEYENQILPQEIINITSSNLQVFRFIRPNISEDYKLYLNGSQVPTSKNIKDLDNDKYIVLSNAVGGVDVFYLNEGSYQYNAGDELKIVFLALKDVEWQEKNITFMYGSINQPIILDTPFSDVDSKEKIRIKAPVYHETQNTVRGRLDFEKLLLTFLGSIIETKGRDVNAATLDITYLKDNYQFMSTQERNDYYNLVSTARTYGRVPTYLSDPEMLHTDLKLKIIIKKGYNPSNLQSEVLEKVSNFENKFQWKFDSYEIEDKIEELEYVKIIRAEVGYDTWQSQKFYHRGDFIYSSIDNDYIFKINRIKAYSGNSEPVWNTNYRDLTFDNEIIWRTEPTKYNPDYWENLPVLWNNNYDYKYYDIVYSSTYPDLMFRCIGFLKHSGSTIPSFSQTLNEITLDNKLLWLTTDYDASAPLWQSNTLYKIGDKVNDSNGNYSFICVQVGEISQLFEPTWNFSGLTEEDNLVWEVYRKEGTKIPINWNEYFKFNSSIEVSYDT